MGCRWAKPWGNPGILFDKIAVSVASLGYNIIDGPGVLEKNATVHMIWVELQSSLKSHIYCREPPPMGLRGYGGLRTVKWRAPSMGDFTHTVAVPPPVMPTRCRALFTITPDSRAACGLTQLNGRVVTIYRLLCKSDQIIWTVACT